MRLCTVRLLRFTVGGGYWRRVCSGLANPYLSCISVYGLQPVALLSANDAAYSRSCEIELIIRGSVGAKGIAHLVGRSSMQELAFRRFAQ
eukprot:1501875-Pleurochrysis_carterae.AAC.1